MPQPNQKTWRIFELIRRLGPLLRLGAEYFAAHMATRLLAAISGLMLVWLLPVSEYGYYSLILSAFMFICTFSDLGATETLSFFRWRAGKKSKPWIPYFHAVLRFRHTVFTLGFVSSAAYVFYTGEHVGEGIQTRFAGIVLIGFAAWFAIQAGIRSFVLKLEQRFRAGYLVELSNEGTKLLAVGMIWTMGLATAIAGMASVAIGALIAAIVASRLLGQRFAQTGILKERHTRRRTRLLLGQIIPILPGTIHFTVQGPLIAWLAAYYGSIVSVAEVGALGRLGALIGIIAGFTGTVFVPRLLAISNDVVFFRRYLQWWVFMFAFGGAVMLVVSFFPQALLLLLGNAYSGLHTELIISAATAVVATWGAFSWHINRARGWVKYQPYRVPVLVAGQVPMFIGLDFSNTQGVLLFALGSVLLDFMFQTLISAAGFHVRHKEQS